MSGLTISMTTGNGFLVGAVLIAIGVLLQYWVGLEMDDWRDAKAQERERAEDRVQRQALDLVDDRGPEPTLVIPVQRVTNGEDLLGGGLR